MQIGSKDDFLDFKEECDRIEKAIWLAMIHEAEGKESKEIEGNRMLTALGNVFIALYVNAGIPYSMLDRYLTAIRAEIMEKMRNAK